MTTLASLDGCSEDVRIKAVVVAELEFRDVQRHVLLADLVERADNAALEDRPEALNRLSVDCADNVLALGMVNGAMREFFPEMMIANPLIGAQETDFFRYSLVNEGLQSRLLHVVNDAGDHAALAATSANDNRLAGSGRTRLAVALVPMPVLCFAADECFVNLDNAARNDG